LKDDIVREIRFRLPIGMGAVSETMDARPDLSQRFRCIAARKRDDDPWVDTAAQLVVWSDLYDRTARASSAGLRPVIGVDLDLTSLLAPEKSVETVSNLVASLDDLASQIAESDRGAIDCLKEIWCQTAPALLPGYTTTAIEAYSLYIAAQIQTRASVNFSSESLALVEHWINQKIFAILRGGYWSRDLSKDHVSPGIQNWASRIHAAGGEIAFMSNRDPSTRDVTVGKLKSMIDDPSQLFAFFGPGGPDFDASSKAAAARAIEAGTPAGVYFATTPNGQPQFPLPSESYIGAGVLVAIIDDRDENRNAVIDAAQHSASQLAQAGLGGVMDIAIGFCPEIAAIEAPAIVSSYEIRDAHAG
jgi:hypothetical protein